MNAKFKQTKDIKEFVNSDSVKLGSERLNYKSTSMNHSRFYTINDANEEGKRY